MTAELEYTITTPKITKLKLAIKSSLEIMKQTPKNIASVFEIVKLVIAGAGRSQQNAVARDGILISKFNRILEGAGVDRSFKSLQNIRGIFANHIHLLHAFLSSLNQRLIAGPF